MSTFVRTWLSTLMGTPTPGPAPPVLPADAGVFRSSPPPGRRPRGPPRRRGGVPLANPGHDSRPESSPPTRGCSGVAVHRDRPTGVLPADAGVFRTTGSAPASSGRPPRRRGGVPALESEGLVRSVSSPPTRGCSARRAARHRPPPVLPADAGVFRRWPPPGVVRSRPPRRRGGVPPSTSSACGTSWSSPPTRGFRPCGSWRRRRVGPPRRRGGVPVRWFRVR